MPPIHETARVDQSWPPIHRCRPIGVSRHPARHQPRLGNPTKWPTSSGNSGHNALGSHPGSLRRGQHNGRLSLAVTDHPLPGAGARTDDRNRTRLPGAASWPCRARAAPRTWWSIAQAVACRLSRPIADGQAMAITSSAVSYPAWSVPAITSPRKARPTWTATGGMVGQAAHGERVVGP
jgi:hypothetical protein